MKTLLWAVGANPPEAFRSVLSNGTFMGVSAVHHGGLLEGQLTPQVCDSRPVPFVPQFVLHAQLGSDSIWAPELAPHHFQMSSTVFVSSSLSPRCHRT